MVGERRVLRGTAAAKPSHEADRACTCERHLQGKERKKKSRGVQALAVRGRR